VLIQSPLGGAQVAPGTSVLLTIGDKDPKHLCE
jgi:hypothetical protein